MNALTKGLLSGLQAALQYKGGQIQQQQEEQIRQRRLQESAAMEQRAWEARERWKQENSPPPAQKVTMRDPNDPSKVIDANQEWQPPSDPNLGPPTQAGWKTVSSAPSASFERLEETQRNNEARNQLAADRLKMQGEYNEARMDAARARLEAQQARGGGEGRLIQKTDENGVSTWGTVKDGVFVPVKDQGGNDLNSQRWKNRSGGFSAAGKKVLPNGTTFEAGEADDIGPSYPLNQFTSERGLSKDEKKELVSGKGSMREPVFVDPNPDRPMSQLGTQQQAPKPQSSQAQALKAAAQAAIAKGADPNQVNARLQQMLEQLGAQ